MPVAKLTDRTYGTLKATARNDAGEAVRTEFSDAYCPGLRRVVQPNGARSWIVRYRRGDRVQRKITATGNLDLNAARSWAQDILKRVNLGEDPAADKHRGTDPEASFAAATANYIKLKVSHFKPTTSCYWLREIERANARWKGRTLASITTKDCIAAIDDSEERGDNAANMRWKVLKSMFAWFADRAEVATSPMRAIKRRHKEVKRKRFLTDAEIKLLWAKADAVKGPAAALAKLLLLTGCRKTEISALEWSEIREGEIVLSADRTKTAVAHRIHITPQMRAVLDECREAGTGRYVLNGKNRPFSPNSRSKDALVIPIDPWRFHDLRRTFVTGCARIKQPVQVVERCVNHALTGMLAIYNQFEYTEEKIECWRAWSDHVEAITR